MAEIEAKITITLESGAKIVLDSFEDLVALDKEIQNIKNMVNPQYSFRGNINPNWTYTTGNTGLTWSESDNALATGKITSTGITDHSTGGNIKLYDSKSEVK